MTAEEGGLSFRQGAGLGWWTPIGILFAGDPERAAAETVNLSRPWKAPVEQTFVAATQAGIAEGMRDGATAASIVDVMLRTCQPPARDLLARGVAIGREATDVPNLVDKLYQAFLTPSSLPSSGETPLIGADPPLPPTVAPIPDTDDKYMSSYFAEQVPLAAAAFVFGEGDPRVCLPTACMIGRDADSVATTVGSWVGALHGESGLPRAWVETVCTVNLGDIDIRGLAERLATLPA